MSCPIKIAGNFDGTSFKTGGANIFYPSSPAAWYFYFHDEKKTKKIAVTPRMTGYHEFVDMLKKKGFPAQSPGVVNFDKKTAGEIFHEMFGDVFGKDNRNEGK